MLVFSTALASVASSAYLYWALYVSRSHTLTSQSIPLEHRGNDMPTVSHTATVIVDLPDSLVEIDE